MTWLTFLTKSAATVGGLFGVALGALYFLQEKIIYVPRLPGIPSEYPYLPDAFRLAYEDVWVTAADGVRLHGWLMWPPHLGPEERRRAPVVIFFHENAGNMALRLPFMAMLVRQLDCPAFIFGYRGYGRSQGTPSEAGIKLDAEAAVDYITARPDLDTDRIVFFGRSLGGAVAVHAAAARRAHVAGLILENTFTKLLDVVPVALPFLRPIIGPGKLGNFLLRNEWDSTGVLPRLADVPTLFLSATRDEMLPPQLMQQLYELHPREPWSIEYFEDATHLDAYDVARHQYWPSVRQFVEGLAPVQPPLGQQAEQQKPEASL